MNEHSDEEFTMELKFTMNQKLFAIQKCFPLTANLNPRNGITGHLPPRFSSKKCKYVRKTTH